MTRGGFVILRNNMKIPFFLFGVACLFLASGCVHNNHYYVPKPSANIDDRVRKFSASGSVTLLNGQPSEEQQLIMESGAHSYYDNPKAWTDVAIQVAERELTKRGLHVVSNSGKRVTMAVESVHTDLGTWVVTTKVVMKVQTSDGFSKTYTGKNIAGGMTDLNHHYNEALGYAVAEMLDDERFIAFVSK